MTSEELKTEIETGPFAASLADAWAAGDDLVVAAKLNLRDRTGYVPARHVSVSLARFPQLDALIHWVMTHGTLPADFGGGTCPFAIYTLFRNLDRVDKSVGNGDLRAAIADLTAGLAAIALTPAAPMIPEGFGAYLLGGEVKISRVEELNWSGVSVTAVGEARNSA